MKTKSSPYLFCLFFGAMAAISCLYLASVAVADIVDEAKAQGKTTADFPADDYDYFGHYFAKDLTSQELDDLIDLLKTF